MNSSVQSWLGLHLQAMPRATGRRAARLLRILTGAALLFAGAAVYAQDDRPVKLLVPFSAGGVQDVLGRHLAQHLSTYLKVPVVVENKAGAGGAIATDVVAKSAPDGKTLLLVTAGAISIAPRLNPKLPYRPERDLTTLAMVADTPMVIAVRADSPIKSLSDFIAHAKRQPGLVSFASTGNATVSHLTGELLAQAAGISIVHVPYRGASAAITDVLGGQVQSIVTSAASLDPVIDSKRVRVLASFTARPLESLNGVPTVTQATGLSNLAVPVWSAVLGPAGLAASEVERVATALQAICALPDTRHRMAEIGATPACLGPKDAARVIAEDTARWDAVLRRVDVKMD